MEKVEYKIKKDKEFKGKRYESYTVEKIITETNGNIEHLYRTLFPHIDGKIDEINLDKVYFPKPITQEEWEQLPQEYKTAWLEGTMTEEMRKYGMSCLQQIRERKLMEGSVA